ncbi:MAG: hypothetical protein NVS9B3_10660 [Gemmatimonadaceae bacterium]
MTLRRIERASALMAVGFAFLGVSSAPAAAAALRFQQPDSLCVPTADTAWVLPGDDAAVGGRQVGSVIVSTEGPSSLPGPAHILDRAHTRTREGVARRLLGIEVGDTLGYATLADAVRRLRATSLFSIINLRAAACADGQTALVTLITRDAWSTRPVVRAASATSAAATLEERNVLGSGRAATVGVASDGATMGLRLGATDPTLFRGQMIATARYAGFPDGRSWSLQLATPEAAVYTPWHLFVVHAMSRRALGADSLSIFVPATTPTDTTPATPDTTLFLPLRSGYDLRRDVSQILVGHQILASPARAVYALAGWERSWTTLQVKPEQRTLGAQTVERRFAGPDVGIGMRGGRMAVVRWALPDSTPLEVPRGFEGEVVVGLGREQTLGVPMRHLDAWAGRAWVVFDRLIVATDAWASGFQRTDTTPGIENGRLRGAIQLFTPGRRGLWKLRIAAERIRSADPDVHALTISDPLLQVVSPRTRLAEAAFVAQLERTFELMQARGQHVQGALFAATSARRGTLDPNFENPVNLYADVVGAGLRLVPPSPTAGAVQLDVGYPFTHSRYVKARWYVALVVARPLLAGRSRDGWR